MSPKSFMHWVKVCYFNLQTLLMFIFTTIFLLIAVAYAVVYGSYVYFAVGPTIMYALIWLVTILAWRTQYKKDRMYNWTMRFKPIMEVKKNGSRY